MDVLACLTQHADRVSAACERFRNLKKYQFDALHQSCAGEAATHCADYQGSRLGCYSHYLSRLSAQCASRFERFVSLIPSR
jgi:hypothetical protein